MDENPPKTGAAMATLRWLTDRPAGEWTSQRQFRRAQVSMRWNGRMMLGASPVLLLIVLCKADKWIEVVLGTAFVVTWAAFSWLAIRWSKQPIPGHLRFRGRR